MIPQHLRALFWDTNVAKFNPAAFPQYAIARVLEFGDEKAITWLRETFSKNDVIEVVRTERRLSRRSANFWALVYRIPADQVAALKSTG